METISRKVSLKSSVTDGIVRSQSPPQGVSLWCGRWFLLSPQGRGASVCHIVERGVHPKAGKVERGYLEDTNNGRVKIRIVATGALDSSFNDQNAKLGDVSRTEVMHERNIWAEPDNWFRCQ